MHPESTISAFGFNRVLGYSCSYGSLRCFGLDPPPSLGTNISQYRKQLVGAEGGDQGFRRFDKLINLIPSVEIDSERIQVVQNGFVRSMLFSKSFSRFTY